jgi:tetratricopeptide (TPR) repeat protein
MIHPRHYLWLPLLLLQSGCAMLTSYSKMEPQIEQWVEAKQYDRALDALGSVDAKDPKYHLAAEKRRKVEALAANYEQEVRHQTRRYLDKGKWSEALDTYDEALDRLPQSAVLKDGLAQLHHEQRNELERLELERLMSHGEWLKQTLPSYYSIARVNPRSNSAQQRLKKKQAEAEQIASELAQMGNKALANDKLDTAEQTLSLAAKLSDTPAIGVSLKKLRQHQSQEQVKKRAERERRQKKQRANEETKSRRVTSLLKAYKKAYGKKDYQRARKELEALKRIDKDNSKWSRLNNQLEQATSREAERLFDNGVSAYSRGHFEKAAKFWRKAVALKPSHKPARENLERAEKVLEKLKELKKKQSN